MTLTQLGVCKRSLKGLKSLLYSAKYQKLKSADTTHSFSYSFSSLSTTYSFSSLSSSKSDRVAPAMSMICDGVDADDLLAG